MKSVKDLLPPNYLASWEITISPTDCTSFSTTDVNVLKQVILGNIFSNKLENLLLYTATLITNCTVLNLNQNCNKKVSVDLERQLYLLSSDTDLFHEIDDFSGLRYLF